MRNLKRALSLAMASVMLLGMMVISAGAATSYNDFSDKDKIANKDAVVMATELGIIQGMPDGTFSPEGNIDRASMTKMICTALNGGRDPQLSGSVVNSYTDTVGNWAAGYIEFCTAMGIVSGKGDKIFAPAANVTGSEAAKMLLVALGYSAETEGMIGANWQVKTDVLANTVNLYDKVVGLTSVPLTRDNAAQMIFNALNASVVKYEGGKSVPLTTTGYVSIPHDVQMPDGMGNMVTVTNYSTVQTQIEKSLLNAKYSVSKTKGILTSNEYAGLTGSVEKAGVSKIGGVKYNVTTTLDMLGKEVIIYAKNTQTNGNTDVTGGAVVSNDNVVVTTNTKNSASDITKLLKGESLAVVLGTNFAKNYSTTDASGTPIPAVTTNAAGQEYVAIDNNNDGNVDYVIQTTYLFGQVTKYSTKDDGTLTVKVPNAAASGTTTFTKDKSKDVVGFEDVKKDDYVLAAEIGDKLYVEPVKTVVGDLTAYKSSDSLTVDGTAHKVSVLGGDLVNADFTDPSAYGSAATLNKEATFYMDKFDNVVAVGSVQGSSDAYALVWGASPRSFGGWDVKVTLSDGTTATYGLNDKTGTVGDVIAVDTDVKMKIFNYSINSDDQITLTTIANQADTDGTKTAYDFEKGKSTINVGGSKYFGNADTVFFNVELKNATTVKSVDVYTGIGNAPSVVASVSTSPATIDSIVVHGTGSNAATAKAAATFGATTAANGDYLYIVKFNNVNNDGAEYMAIMAGEDEPIAIQTDDSIPVVNGVYQYIMSSKGFYQLKSAPTNYITGFITNLTGRSIILGVKAAGTGSIGEYVLNTDALVSYIDGGDSTTGDSLSKGDFVTLVFDAGNKVTGAFILENDDENANVVYTSLTTSTTANVNYTADLSELVNVAGLKGAITVSNGASFKVVANGTDTADLAKAILAHSAGDVASISAGTSYKIVILNAAHTAYSVKVVEVVA